MFKLLLFLFQLLYPEDIVFAVNNRYYLTYFFFYELIEVEYP